MSVDFTTILAAFGVLFLAVLIAPRSTLRLTIFGAALVAVVGGLVTLSGHPGAVFLDSGPGMVTAREAAVAGAVIAAGAAVALGFVRWMEAGAPPRRSRSARQYQG